MAYREFSDPLGGELRRAFEEQNLGQPLEIVLRKLSQRVPSMDVQFFVSAVLLQKRTGGMGRLTPVPAQSADLLPSAAQLWRDLVSRLGSVVPTSARDLPRLKRRLVRAGFRSLNAARYFQGARLVTTVSFAAVALLAAWRSYASLGNVVLVTGAAAALGYIAPAQYVQ